MADFEDSTTPTWENLLDGQLNLIDAVRRTITYDDPSTHKSYKLIDNPAVLFVRPRGWHLEERHLVVDGEPMSGSLFDFGLYVFHNAQELLARGSGPYFYLPKIESHLEARLWNDVFVRAQDRTRHPTRHPSAPPSSSKPSSPPSRWTRSSTNSATTPPASTAAAGTTSSPSSRSSPRDTTVLLPDRCAGHHDHALHAQLLEALHQDLPSPPRPRHGRHVRASFPSSPTPSPTSARSHRSAPTRSAKPPTATTAPGSRTPASSPSRSKSSTASCPAPTRSTSSSPTTTPPPPTCSQVPTGTITEAGLKQNVAVGLGYVEAWLRGIGCVPLFNLMEDAATAEISRAQLWQWVHHGAKLTDGPNAGSPSPPRSSSRPSTTNSPPREPKVDATRYYAYERAAVLMRKLIESPTFPDFLTVPAYARILDREIYTA